jgi:acylphosphatase
MIVHVFVSGFVQGVGYRQFVKRSARTLNLTGWVKNLPDNRVEALFCGPEEQVEKLISLCKKGPFLSDVKDVQISTENVKIASKNFDIIS